MIINKKDVDPETPAKTNLVANAEATKILHQLIIITHSHCSNLLKK